MVRCGSIGECGRHITVTVFIASPRLCQIIHFLITTPYSQSALSEGYGNRSYCVVWKERVVGGSNQSMECFPLFCARIQRSNDVVLYGRGQYSLLTYCNTIQTSGDRKNTRHRTASEIKEASASKIEESGIFKHTVNYCL